MFGQVSGEFNNKISTTVTIPALPTQSVILSNKVDNAQGSSVPGCEPDCFIPSTISINVGESIVFANTDSAAHTSTSGTSSFGPSGHWDSSLLMTGQSYEVSGLEQGTYHYFCMVHPWMEGKLVVGTGLPLRTSEPIIELIDITPPNIITSNKITVSTTNSTGATVTYNKATATDNKEITAVPYCHPASGSIFPVGTTKASCTVTDLAGNTATKTFDVVVINSLAVGDKTAPIFSQPNVISVDATTANGAVVMYEIPSVKDDYKITY